MNSPKTIQEGVDLLDKHFGSRAWILKINPEEIVMSNCLSCVLGQIFGGYSIGHRTLNLTDETVLDVQSHNVFAERSCNPLKDPTKQWKDFLSANKTEVFDITKEYLENNFGKIYLLTFDDGKSMIVSNLKDAPKSVLFTYKEI